MLSGDGQMPYEALIAPLIVEKIEGLAPGVRGEVAMALHRLCESPTAVSTPAPSPPNKPGFQMYEFAVEADDGLHHFRFLFNYASDEQTLLIAGLGHIEP